MFLRELFYNKNLLNQKHNPIITDSKNWVLFQPNIIIDARLGCLWYVQLMLEPLCTLITDRDRLVEFILQRSNGKDTLLSVLSNLVNKEYTGVLLPTILKCFDRLNEVYRVVVDYELESQMGTPSSIKSPAVLPRPHSTPRVVIDQNDMCIHVFNYITDSEQIGKILLLYIQSLLKYNIEAQDVLSRLLISDLVNRHHFNTLQKTLNFSFLNESKPLACYLLSLGNVNASINQMAIDMLSRLNATEVKIIYYFKLIY